MTIALNMDPLQEARSSRYVKWAIALFFVTLFIPGSLYIGVRMTPYRLYLIVMALPMIQRFRNDPTIRITAVDVLVFLAVSWRSLAILVNHGMADIVMAVSSFIELFWGYMLGRVFVRNPADYRYFFKCFLLTLLAFLPFAVLEFVLHKRVIRDVFSTILEQPVASMRDQLRFGFMRVQLSFEHGLLFGMFCVTGFANVFYCYRHSLPRRVVYALFVAAMAAMTISSSAMLALTIQTSLMLYERVLQFLKVKWAIFALVALVIWFSFDALFGKTIPEYVVTELVINTTGAQARIDQITYGSLEIYRNPVFGIGLQDWARPFWSAGVFDNFWLAVAVRYGIPALALIMAVFVLQFWRVAFKGDLDEDERDLRTGYLIAFTVLILMLGSLQIYGITMTYVMVYVGMGSWFYDRPAVERTRRRRLDSAARDPLRRPGPALDRPRVGTGRIKT